MAARVSEDPALYLLPRLAGSSLAASLITSLLQDGLLLQEPVDFSFSLFLHLKHFTENVIRRFLGVSSSTTTGGEERALQIKHGFTVQILLFSFSCRIQKSPLEGFAACRL